MTKVKEGDEVTVHYTGQLEDGSVFDSSEGKDPLTFVTGAGELIPGFDLGVQGMTKGEKRRIEIECQEAYGERREELIQEIEKSVLPADLTPEVGLQLQIGEPEDNVFVTISEVKENSVTLDANHPLAGKKLIFDIEVVEIAAKS